MSKPKITEANIIRAIGGYLQYQRNQGKLMYIRNNSGAMPVIDGKNKRRYIRFGDKGSPDFLVWIPEGIYQSLGCLWVLRGIGIECKSETGKQSADQIKWQVDFEKLGGEYYVVRSIEEAINIIKGR